MSTDKKIAVAGATGRVGHHVVDVLTERGHDVVPISRTHGVDVITGEGLAEALAGVECIVDAATGPSPEQEAATEFFTTATRNLQVAGSAAGVQRIIVVSIIGTDRFTAATASRRSRTSGRCCPARSRRGCCARRSSTSSSSSWWSGARRATSPTCPRCAPSSSPRGPSPRRSPTSPSTRAAGARFYAGGRRPARGEPRRDGDAPRRPAGRLAARRGRQRSRSTAMLQRVRRSSSPAPTRSSAGPTFEEWLG